MNVCILGSSGLLGSTLHRYIDSQSDMSISEPTRDMISSVLHDSRLMDTMTREFDVIVNCVGIVKPKMKEMERPSGKTLKQADRTLFRHAAGHTERVGKKK